MSGLKTQNYRKGKFLHHDSPSLKFTTISVDVFACLFKKKKPSEMLLISTDRCGIKKQTNKKSQTER